MNLEVEVYDMIEVFSKKDPDSGESWDKLQGMLNGEGRCCFFHKTKRRVRIHYERCWIGSIYNTLSLKEICSFGDDDFSSLI